jgi:hypothetical protein
MLLQGRHRSHDLLPALAAERLSRLHRGAASIAEHLFLHAEIVNAEIVRRCCFFATTHLATTHWLTDSTQYTRKSSAESLVVGAEFYSRVVVCGVNRFTKQKKPPGNRAASLFTRENSSNGGKKSRQNFLAKSYGPKKGGVKQFLVNKCLYFQ